MPKCFSISSSPHHGSSTSRLFQRLLTSFLLAIGFAFLFPIQASAKARLARALAEEVSHVKAVQASLKKGAKLNYQPNSRFLRTSESGMWLLNFFFDPTKTTSAEAEQQLMGAGAKGTQSCLGLNIVQAWVRPEQIETLANLPEITFIGLTRVGKTNAGEVNSEGDQAIRADQARNLFGVTGEGIKVGIISDGSESNASAKLTGDIPANIYVRPPLLDVRVTQELVDETIFETIMVTSGTQPNITTVSVLTSHVVTKLVITTQTTLLEGGPGEGDEGTAMMEIVHDLAPNAQLGFAPGLRTDVEFINAVNDLAHNFDADVIVDDIGWFTEPIYEAGPVALACQQAVKFKGVHYFTAAGNSGDSHYNAVFNASQLPNLPGTSGYLHNFGNGRNYMTLAPAFFPAIYVIWLYWNDPFNAPVSSYKLKAYLTKQLQAQVAISENLSNYFFDHPVAAEVIQITVPSFLDFDQEVILAVEHEYGPATHFSLLQLPFTHEFSETQQPHSIFGHAGIPEVNTVGAVYQGVPDFLEPFSSQGPSTVYYPFFVNRSKPDFVAPDGVSVTGVGGGVDVPFFGTSAAAPHAAAVGALMLEAKPELTPPQLQRLMQRSAVPLSRKGFNYSSGWGRVDAVNAVAAARNSRARNWAVYE